MDWNSSVIIPTADRPDSLPYTLAGQLRPAGGPHHAARLPRRPGSTSIQLAESEVDAAPLKAVSGWTRAGTCAKEQYP